MRINTKQHDGVKINNTEVEDIKYKEQAEEGMSSILQPTQDLKNKQSAAKQNTDQTDVKPGRYEYMNKIWIHEHMPETDKKEEGGHII